MKNEILRHKKLARNKYRRERKRIHLRLHGYPNEKTIKEAKKVIVKENMFKKLFKKKREDVHARV